MSLKAKQEETDPRAENDESTLDARIRSLDALGDVPPRLVRLPYNLVVSGDRPYWLEAETYVPGEYRGIGVHLFGSGRIEGPALRLPVAMDQRAFSEKRHFLEGREDDPRVLSIAGGGLYVPGQKSHEPQGAFGLNAPPRSVYAVALSYEGSPVYFLPTRDGLDRVHSPHAVVDKPIRQMIKHASHSGVRSIGIEELR